MKRMLSKAEEADAIAVHMLEHFRESFLLCFRTMTQGLPEKRRKEALAVLRFFETETNENVWRVVNEVAPDVAADWLTQWESLAGQYRGGEAA
jgi:hypothetical protein